MNKVEFYNNVQPIIMKAMELSNTKMTNKERAEKTIDYQNSEMKFFAKYVEDELSGNKVNLLA